MVIISHFVVFVIVVLILKVVNFVLFYLKDVKILYLFLEIKAIY